MKYPKNPEEGQVIDSPPRNLKEHFDAQPCYVEERLYMSEKSFEEFVGSPTEESKRMKVNLRLSTPVFEKNVWSYAVRTEHGELSGELVDVLTSMREFLNATVEDQVKMAMEVAQLKKRIADLEASAKEAKTKLAFL